MQGKHFLPHSMYVFVLLMIHSCISSVFCNDSETKNVTYYQEEMELRQWLDSKCHLSEHLVRPVDHYADTLSVNLSLILYRFVWIEAQKQK